MLLKIPGQLKKLAEQFFNLLMLIGLMKTNIVSLVIVGILIAACNAGPKKYATTSLSNDENRDSSRPPAATHIKEVQHEPNIDPALYIQYVDDCLSQIEVAGRNVFGDDYIITIDKLEIIGGKIAAGSTSDTKIELAGPADKGTACHEVFHIFDIQGWFSGKIKQKHTSMGKTSPLFEAIPQVFAVLGTKDCLIGREGRGQLAYDACSEIKWADLPPLETTAKKEMSIAKEMGLDTKYWERILSDPDSEKLNSPSAFYSALPLAHNLYVASDVCGYDILKNALIRTFVRQSFEDNHSFDSIKEFSPFLLEEKEIINKPDCLDKLKERMALTGLL